jgi:hypothetical protein
LGGVCPEKKESKRGLRGTLSIVFYDETTPHFEIEQEDELRRTGFSKEGKYQHPQILLGLLVSVDAYPLGYELFEGNAPPTNVNLFFQLLFGSIPRSPFLRGF